MDGEGKLIGLGKTVIGGSDCYKMELYNTPTLIAPGNFSLRTKITTCKNPDTGSMYSEDINVKDSIYEPPQRSDSAFRVYKQDVSKTAAESGCRWRQMELAKILSSGQNYDVLTSAQNHKCK